jgi:serine phosphatase RsbU (regulator of sigma subunit)
MSIQQENRIHHQESNHFSNASQAARIRLSGDLSAARYALGERLHVNDLATTYNVDLSDMLRLLSDLETLGMVVSGPKNSVMFQSNTPKEMQEAYEIRAALEEIGGRAAAKSLKGKTQELRCRLDAVRAAVREGDMNAYVAHDVEFHRGILAASENDVLLRLWDTLFFDVRLRAVISKVSTSLANVVESHNAIIDALDAGHGKEAGLLLRNHSESFLQFLKKAERDSGFHRELQIARIVQEALVSEQSPSIPGLSCQAFYKPARTVGGDYYDFIPLEEGSWGIAIGDVSGKGIGAALMMASLQASLRAHALNTPPDVPNLINNLNRLVYKSSPEHFYASLFYARYQPDTRSLTYVNAGHVPPIVLRRGNGLCQVFELNSGGPPVGMFADSRYASATFQLEASDSVVAYTDGITEAQTDEDELWGRQRLESLICSSRGATPQEIVQRIVSEVSDFAAGGSQTDDMTLLVMEVREEQSEGITRLVS